MLTLEKLAEHAREQSEVLLTRLILTLRPESTEKISNKIIQFLTEEYPFLKNIFLQPNFDLYTFIEGMLPWVRVLESDRSYLISAEVPEVLKPLFHSREIFHSDQIALKDVFGYSLMQLKKAGNNE